MDSVAGAGGKDEYKQSIHHQYFDSFSLDHVFLSLVPEGDILRDADQQFPLKSKRGNVPGTLA